MMTTNYTVSFKDTLFETVSLEPWPLAYKMIFTEVRMGLTEALQDLHNWYTAVHTTRLLEADPSDETPSYQKTLDRFKALPALSPEHITKLKAQFENPDRPPPGLINKLFNSIKKGLERINKTVHFPKLDDKIQNYIVKLKAKYPDNKAWQTVLGWAKGLSGKRGWVPSVLLLGLGTIATLFSMPLLGNSVLGVTIAFSIFKCVADLVNGKSVSYAIGKAVTLAAGGSLIGMAGKALGVDKTLGVDKALAYLWKLVSPSAEAAEQATPPLKLFPGTGYDTASEYLNGQAGSPDYTQSEYPEYLSGQAGSPDYTPISGPGDSPQDFGGSQGSEYAGSSGPFQEPITTKANDNLGLIAQRKGVTVKDIMDANPTITNPHRIPVGMTLQIPAAGPSGTNVWDGFDFDKYPMPGRR